MGARLRVFGAGVVGLTSLAGGVARAQGWEPSIDPEQSQPAPGPAQPEAESVPATGASDLHAELGAEVAYVTPPIRGGTNPFGAGFGARAGLVWSGVYLGISVMDFLGGSDVDVSYRALLYGIDLGYGLRVPAFGDSWLTVRPKVGFGDAAVSYTDPSLAADVVTSASGSSSSSSDTITVNNVYLRPGLTVMLTAGAHYAAVDASMLVLPGIAYGGADATTWLSYGAQAELGFFF